MKQVALTFDDGPCIGITDQVLEKLKKYQVVASFFVIGEQIKDSTKYLLQQAVELGCDIQNHSNTHPDFTKLTKEEMIEEVNVTTKKIYDSVGVNPTFFRPPYISVNQMMFETIDLPFIVGFGALDWEPQVPCSERARRIIEQACDGAIFLLHDMEHNQATVDALDLIIPKLLEEGYEFVTVTDLFTQKQVTPKKNDYVMYTDILHPNVFHI